MMSNPSQDTILGQIAAHPEYSTYFLSDLRKNQVTALVNYVYADIVSLDTEIEMLEDQLKTLELQRRMRSIQLEKLTQFRVTWIDLPTEALLRIFDLCSSGNHIDIPIRLPHAIWILSRVCSQWRHIITNEPLMWTQLHIRFMGKRPKQNNAIREILQRSGECPLKISIFCDQVPTERTSMFLRGFFHAIIDKSSSHLEKLALKIRPELFPYLTTAIDKTEGGLYTVAELKIDDLSQSATDFLRRHVKSNMPRLSKVTLGAGGVLMESSPEDIPIPWIRCLDIALPNCIISPSSARNVLSRCGRLTSLHFVIGSLSWKGPNDQVSTLPALQLPMLRELSLGFYGSIELMEFLQALHVPDLARLRITHRRPERTGLWEARPLPVDLPESFTEWICRCGRLKSLELVHVQSIDFLRILTSIPDIERLFVGHADIFPAEAISSIIVEQYGRRLSHLHVIILVEDVELTFTLLFTQWSTAADSSRTKGARAFIRKIRVWVLGAGRGLCDRYNDRVQALKETTGAFECDAHFMA